MASSNTTTEIIKTCLEADTFINKLTELKNKTNDETYKKLCDDYITKLTDLKNPKEEDKSMKTNLEKIKEIIKNQEYSELLKYNKFDFNLLYELKTLFYVDKNINIDILKHIIDNLTVNISCELMEYILLKVRNKDIIKYLYEKNNTILEQKNRRKLKLIHETCQYGNYEIVKWFLTEFSNLIDKNDKVLIYFGFASKEYTLVNLIILNDNLTSENKIELLKLVC